MEILAQKKRGTAWPYVIFIIIGAFSLTSAAGMFIAFLSFMGRQAVIPAASLITLVVAGIFLIIFGIVFLLRIKRSPDCITLSGNQVDLGNGLIVSIRQITDVDYREDRARYRTYSWGTLTVYLENQKLNYYFIADVRHARDKIMDLILKSKHGI